MTDPQQVQFWSRLFILMVVGGGIVMGMITSTRNARHLARLLAEHSRAEMEARATHTASVLKGLDAVRLALIRLQPPAALDVPKVILMIDDDPAMLHLVSIIGARIGYVIRTAASAEAALHSLTVDGLPDLIVADIRLGSMDGLEFARQIRWAGCIMPILAYSSGYLGANDHASRRLALAAGCNDIIAKTGSAEDLPGPIARWLAIAASVAGRHTMPQALIGDTQASDGDTP